MTQDSDASVLVAEDNVTNQLAMKALLNYFGVKADFVSNGHEAVEAYIKDGQYKLILMDLMMPVMDGFEAAKEIRQHEYGSGRHTPIVAVTAMDVDISKQKCVDAGMDDYISKPVDLNALKDRLTRWLLPSIAIELVEEMQAEKPDSISTSLDHLRELYGTNDIDGLLDSFLTVTNKLLASLTAAIDAHDLGTAAHIANEVKGSSLAVSAEEMVQISILLEQSIREENWIEVVKLYSDLAAAFQRITESLKSPVAAIIQAQRNT